MQPQISIGSQMPRIHMILSVTLQQYWQPDATHSERLLKFFSIVLFDRCHASTDNTPGCNCLREASEKQEPIAKRVVGRCWGSL